MYTFIVLPFFRETGWADSGIVKVNWFCHFQESDVICVGAGAIAAIWN